MIKILSKAKDEFEIDGVEILPGVDTYKLDTKKRNIRYQLVLLKNEGVIDFNERLKFDMKELPVDPKKDKAEAEELAKKAAKRKEIHEAGKVKQAKLQAEKQKKKADEKKAEDAKALKEKKETSGKAAAAKKSGK